MKNIAGVGVIVLGVLWSCGGSEGLGFDEPDEEDLGDIWHKPINDGDVDTELEFMADGVYEERVEREPVEVERGRWELTSADASGEGVPLLRFIPDDGTPRDRYIIFYDATTLDLAGDPQDEPDLAFPSYRR